MARLCGGGPVHRRRAFLPWRAVLPPAAALLATLAVTVPEAMLAGSGAALADGMAFFFCLVSTFGVAASASVLVDRVDRFRPAEDDAAAPAPGRAVTVRHGRVGAGARTIASGLDVGGRTLRVVRVRPGDDVVLALEVVDGDGEPVAAVDACAGPAHVDWTLRVEGHTARVRVPRSRRLPQRRTVLTGDGRAWALTRRGGGLAATVPPELSDAGVAVWVWLAGRLDHLVPVPDRPPARVRGPRRLAGRVLVAGGIAAYPAMIVLLILLTAGHRASRWPESLAGAAFFPLCVLVAMVVLGGSALLGAGASPRAAGHRAGIEGRSAVLLPTPAGSLAILDEDGREIGTVERRAGRVWVATGDQWCRLVEERPPVADAGTPVRFLALEEPAGVRASASVVPGPAYEAWRVRVEGREVVIAAIREPGARQTGVDGAGGSWTVASDAELATLVAGAPPGAPAPVLAGWTVLAAALREELDTLLPVADVVTSPG